MLDLALEKSLEDFGPPPFSRFGKHALIGEGTFQAIAEKVKVIEPQWDDPHQFSLAPHVVEEEQKHHLHDDDWIHLAIATIFGCHFGVAAFESDNQNEISPFPDHPVPIGKTTRLRFAFIYFTSVKDPRLLVSMPIKSLIQSGGTPSVGRARQVKETNHVVYLDPRISAAKLAEYVVADPSRQETIARNAKRAPIVLTAPYNRVRCALPGAFTARGLGADALRASSRIEIASDDNDWQRKEKERSSAALLKLADIAPEIDVAGASLIHKPEGGWPNVMMGSTFVSVQPELVFSTVHRGITKVGAIILNMGQSENLSLARHNGRFSVGDYLSALLVRFLADRLPAHGVPLNTKCFAVDVHRGVVHSPPGSYKTLIKHMEAACRTLASLWDSLPGLNAVDDLAEEDIDF